jgi:hypothetical protein
MYFKKFALLISLLIITCGLSIPSFGQCGTCTVFVNGNDAPSATIANNSTVCIRGNRTSLLNFGNSSGITICIEDGASWNGDFTNLASLTNLTNFGTLALANAPAGNWIITNYGTASLGNLLAANRSILNYGRLTSTAAFAIASNSNFLSNGILQINGNLAVNGNVNTSLIGATTVTGNVTLASNSTINLGGSLSVSGNFSVAANSIVQGVNTNLCNSLSVTGTFSNSGVISGGGLQSPDSPLFVNKAPSGVTISNGAAVGSCPASTCMQSFQVTTANGFDWVYVFNCTSNFVLPPLLPGEELIDISVAVIGGGGAGGFGEAAGGGGAGAIFERSSKSLAVGRTYTVAVGPGGVGASDATVRGGNGFTSAFFGSVAPGGGGGGSQSSGARAGNVGGSGGGGGAHNNPGAGTGNGGGNSGNRTNGGGNGSRNPAGNQLNGGGGGGASSSGQNGSNNNPGIGGNGIALPILNGISGLTNAFAGGGGATGRNPAQQYGSGTGGVFSGIALGGDGGHLDPGVAGSTGVGQSGRASTGSGGGAGSVRGGAGSGGRVIVRASYRILPIEVMEIKGQFMPENRSSLLNWSILGFQDQLLMTVQRAVNSVETWSELDTLKAEFEKPELRAFSYEDEKLPLAGGTLFYRIKLSHPDGTVYGYSNVVALEVEPKNGVEIWTAYPNPSGRSKVRLSYLGSLMEHDSPIFAQLSDFSGKSVEKQSNSLAEITDWLNDRLEKSGNGIFILKLTQGNAQGVIKLLNY